jgi:hypothetical protein
VRVGDSLEIPYRLRGSLPGGEYHVLVEAYERTFDGVLRVELGYRAGGSDAGVGVDGGSYRIFLSGVGHPPDPDGGSFTYFETKTTTGAITAACGDTMILRITAVSGSSDFIGVTPTVDLP